MCHFHEINVSISCLTETKKFGTICNLFVAFMVICIGRYLSVTMFLPNLTCDKKCENNVKKHPAKTRGPHLCPEQ